MNRIASFWSETSPSARWVTYVSVPLGTCMAVLGLIGDSHGWWENRSFLTNLLSSTTSVLFGIPTALIVLSWLGTHQAEVLERRAALRRTRLAARELRETLFRNLRSDDAAVALGHVANLRRPASMRQASLREIYREDLNNRVSDEASTRWREAQRSWEEAVNACFANTTPGGLREWSGDLTQAWRHLDEEIRPRLASVGLRWIPSTTYNEVRGSMENLAAAPRAFFPGVPDTAEVLAPDLQGRTFTFDRHEKHVAGELGAIHALHVLLSAVDELGQVRA
ncbi:hypothetical protein [Streptomyces sp. NPDC057293]|uniref:hypothetical protein n=1 Tax=unclassified Streptomyces TaxID=2593676 RepID=UPI0036433AE5